MRRKKHKHTRRSVAFYKINHGFREPFKVLLDGNFIHATLQANMPHFGELLSRLLGGEVRLFTTSCVTRELLSLGPDLAPAAKAARAQSLHKCGHAPPQPACDCLLATVAGGNAGHWWVATQDKGLQAALAEQAGGPVPLLFASVNGLHLADPPAAAKDSVAAAHAAAQALPSHERASEALADLEALRPRDEGWKKFRRKHAKAPNPLAVKKKTKPKAAAVAAPADAAAADAPAKKRRRRKHKAAASGGDSA